MTEKSIGGMIVYCSDPRPEKAGLWKHIKRLLIPADQRFTPVGLLGAPVALARPADFPVKLAAILEDTDFAIEEFSESKFIVVGHDCGIYKRLAKRFPNRQFSLQEKMDDVAKAAEFLRERYPGVPVSAFFFKNTQPGFEQIT